MAVRCPVSDRIQQLVDSQQAVADVSVPIPLDVGLLVVVFVGDVADDLFDQVFGGDDAGCAAVFIDDHGHLESVCPDLLHQCVTVETCRNHGDVPREGAQLRGGARGQRDGERLLDVDDADDVVEVAAIEDRESGVARPG